MGKTKKEKQQEIEEAKRKEEEQLNDSSYVSNIVATAGCNTSGLQLEAAIRESIKLGEHASFEIFEKAPSKPLVRAQFPGFDPIACASSILDEYATGFAELRREEIDLFRSRRVRLQGNQLNAPGPPRVTKLDMARAHAQAACLTLPDYFEEQKKRDERFVFRKRHKLKQEEERITLLARDPRPKARELDDAADAVIAARFGADAAARGEARRAAMGSYARRALAFFLVEFVYVLHMTGFNDFQMDNAFKPPRRPRATGRSCCGSG